MPKRFHYTNKHHLKKVFLTDTMAHFSRQHAPKKLCAYKS